ncbi:hypothetical protein BLD44_013110 [Mastigocladus laminosus UU774]|nr:hypothetical protein BLD44_013110 [Mastigocladus laminosus UU774]
MYSYNYLKAELNAKGWRFTHQREMVLQVFHNLPKGNHLSAEEVYDILARPAWRRNEFVYGVSQPQREGG